jgi:hypothetical protein
MQVLSEFGERHLSRTKNKLLTDDLSMITLSSMDTEVFITLKLCSPDWEEIEAHIQSEHDKDTRYLITLLKRPYGDFYNYNQPWSLGKLQSVCMAENVKLPDRQSV